MGRETEQRAGIKGRCMGAGDICGMHGKPRLRLRCGPLGGSLRAQVRTPRAPRHCLPCCDLSQIRLQECPLECVAGAAFYPQGRNLVSACWVSHPLLHTPQTSRGPVVVPYGPAPCICRCGFPWLLSNVWDKSTGGRLAHGVEAAIITHLGRRIGVMVLHPRLPPSFLHVLAHTMHKKGVGEAHMVQGLVIVSRVGVQPLFFC